MATIELETFELERLLAEAGRRGAKTALQELGLTSKFISQTQAFRIYGRGVVERWVQEGLVKRHKDGDNSSRVRYESDELERLAGQNNRTTYLTTKERKTEK